MAGMLIVDLDDTLIDSQSLLATRKAKNWKECVRRCGEVAPFPGILDLITRLKAEGVLIGVVTNSVSYYASHMLAHCGIVVDTLVAWHDTSQHKPRPEPVVEAISRLGNKNPAARDCIVGLGDAGHDHAAYKAAGLLGVGAGWSPVLDRTAGWDRVASVPGELLALYPKCPGGARTA